jgi:uncharacterized membrane protein YdjX (TVP38/TMEM64 family)
LADTNSVVGIQEEKKLNKKIKRYLPLIAILLGMGVLYFSGFYRYLSFDCLRIYHHTLKSFIEIHPVAVPILYILTYILLTALSVPGAVFLTLLGGYLFPQPLSTIYVIFSATCGAILIFLAARTALADFLREKAGPFLKKMEKGFQENGASYMLFLRFVPLFPFWIVNIAPAFFGVRLRTFVWTTLVGIAPGSFVFTLAGAGLETIFDTNQPFSISAIFNTQMKIALSLLGVFALVPILIKKIKKSRDRNKPT